VQRHAVTSVLSHVDSQPLSSMCSLSPSHWQKSEPTSGFSFPEHRFYSLGRIPTRGIVDMLGAEQDLALDAALVAFERSKSIWPSCRTAASTITGCRSATRNRGRVPRLRSGGSRRTTLGVLEH